MKTYLVSFIDSEGDQLSVPLENVVRIRRDAASGMVNVTFLDGENAQTGARLEQLEAELEKQGVVVIHWG